MKYFRRVLSVLSLHVLTGMPVAQALYCTDPTIPASNPDSVYVDHGDGTASDTRSGLMWKRCAEGQTWNGATCTGSSAGTVNWNAALSQAVSSGFAGHSDWRLPNIKELRSLVEECRVKPSINDAIFPATPSAYFWSASPNAVNSSYAWYLSFDYGSVNSDGIRILGNYHVDGRVRLVRGGASLASFDTLAVPAALASVVEFYNTSLDNYFITANASEAAAIDSGGAGPGWIRTGNSFKSGGSASVCRFYGSQSPGPNSHFYTVDPGECESLKQIQASTPATQPRWNFETLDFVSTPSVNGACLGGTAPVYRAYNNGNARGVDSNHRITSSLAAIQQVVARGWSNEGVVMCAPL